jgi:hypothetical protein
LGSGTWLSQTWTAPSSSRRWAPPSACISRRQPSAADQNRFLKSHSWDEYAAWHLGLTDGRQDGTKARYAFVLGDLRRIHRTGIIAVLYRAAEWRHKAVEKAAYQLLQDLDRKAGIA